jgi:hypothetical protein
MRLQARSVAEVADSALLVPHLLLRLAGKWGYYALGAYGSLCMAIFMVKTMKRVIFQETRTYGERHMLSQWGFCCVSRDTLITQRNAGIQNTSASKFCAACSHILPLQFVANPPYFFNPFFRAGLY